MIVISLKLFGKILINIQQGLKIENAETSHVINSSFCLYFVGKRPNIKHHYRGSELALWLDLMPKINSHSGAKADESQHQLKNAKNLSTFDDSTRLISNFHRIFPSPPPTPPMTPIQNDDVYVTNYPPYDRTGRNTPRSTIRQTSDDEATEPGKDITTTDKGAVAGQVKQESLATSSVPLSITVAIGCSLLFINILIYAGVYYQRERIKKIKQGEAAEAARNTQSRGNGNEPDGDEMTTVPVNHLSGALSNSKPDIQNNPIYSVISKQSDAPDKYTYTAVPTNTNSPMHRARAPHSQTNSVASSARSGNSLNHISGKPPDRSPANSDRSINKHNQTSGSGSNNAITIV